MGNSESFNVWWRTEEDGPIGTDPYWYGKPTVPYTAKQLKQAIKGQTIAVLKVEGSLPLAHKKLCKGLIDLCCRQLPENQKDLKLLSNCPNLTRLIIGSNSFPNGIPEIVTSLRHLEQLDLWDTGLSSLPDSLHVLEGLRVLDLRWNKFETIPEVVLMLKNLELFNVEGNTHLQKLHKGLMDLPKLKMLICTRCDAMKCPPRSVANQGLKAIKQYYKNLAEGSKKQIPVTTVAVIGRSFAGKTSLIKTLQSEEGTRVLTNRNPGDKERATKVFEVQPVSLIHKILNFIDFGGHEVYHICYQLTVRENCIPLIVVNIKQYKDLCSKLGKEEATRKAGMDWIAHLYMSCPGLGAPFLVFTHKDCFTLDEFSSLKNRFLQVSEDLRRELIHDDNRVDGPASSMSHISDLSRKLFIPFRTFEVGIDDNYEEFHDLKERLASKSAEYAFDLPDQWMHIKKSLHKNDDVPFVSVPELTSELSEPESLDVVLQHLHYCGEILWFKNLPEPLKHYVFHKIPIVTDMLAVIFNHDHEKLWMKRCKEFTRLSLPGDQVIEKEEYAAQVENFHKSGVLCHTVLSHILKTESAFNTDEYVQVAIDLLKSFRLIHGPVPVDGQQGFIIPSFANEICSCPELPHPITLQTNIIFKGLALPQYVYQQMSVTLLQLHPEVTSTPIVCQDGVMICHGYTCSKLEFNHGARTVILQVYTDVAHIDVAWEQMVNSIQQIVKQTSDTWKATRAVCSSVCSHCLLKGKENPETKICSDWCRVHKQDADAYLNPKEIFLSGVEPVMCGSETDVPKPLKFPCKALSTEDRNQLQTYVSKMQKYVDEAERRSKSERTSSQCSQCGTPQMPRPHQLSSSGVDVLHQMQQPNSADAAAGDQVTRNSFSLDIHSLSGPSMNIQVEDESLSIDGILNNNLDSSSSQNES